MYKTSKYLIARGNPTLLVWGNFGWQEKNKIIQQYLGNSVDQIGFISTQNADLPTLEMMGNELCINATLAFASTLQGSDKLLTSGLSEPIQYQNTNGQTTLKLKLNYTKTNNVIILDGIGFVLLNSINDLEIVLKNLCTQYKLPAFGAITMTTNKINPYVWVQQTQSLINESACGSGSIAASILSGFTTIIQPSEGKISIIQEGNIFIVSAKVTKVS